METRTELHLEGLRVTRRGKCAKSRSWIQIQGTAPPTKLGVYDATVRNGERAFAERYFRCEVTPGVFEPALKVDDGAFDEPELETFADGVLTLMPPISPATHREVVGAYVGLKRKRYEDALARLESFGLSKRHARLVAFIKFEKQALDKAPRVINPRSAEYNIELGRFLKFAEEPFFHAIDQVWGCKTVIKGVDPEGAAQALRTKWEKFADPVAIGLDAKKFDMHVSCAALRFEHCFYLALYMRCSMADAIAFYDKPGGMGATGTVDRLRWLLKQQLTNAGKARFQDGLLRFEMKGTRSSGDLNTSLGNCILMCSLVHAYASRLGLRVALANNGDDCVVIMDRGDEARFRSDISSYFGEHGFRMEVEPTTDVFERISFCQSQPVCVNGSWRMVRNPLTTIQKAAMCLVPAQNERVLRKWLMAVGLCEGVLGSGVPVLQEWATAYRRAGCRAGIQFRRRIFHHSLRSRMTFERALVVETVEPSTRVSFYRAFGVTPEQQIALESHYRELQLTCRVQGMLTHGEAKAKPGVAWPSATASLAGRVF